MKDLFDTIVDWSNNSFSIALLTIHWTKSNILEFQTFFGPHQLFE